MSLDIYKRAEFAEAAPIHFLKIIMLVFVRSYIYQLKPEKKEKFCQKCPIFECMVDTKMNFILFVIGQLFLMK